MNKMTAENRNGFAIRCEQLTRHYGDVVAIDRLDLQVPYGSIFGFLGRNGAGKTTTIRLLTGLAHPTSGTAWIDGVETTGADSNARQAFGYLPQDPAFYNWMTPREYLDYTGRLFSMETQDRKRRVEELIELVGLQDAAKRKIGGFSGGMHQRLGIAQALIHNPPVLLLDEPTSALDPAGRYEVLDLILKLRGKVTVFLSSHILADIERVCDTVAIIRKGELVLVTDREELLDQYAVNAIELELDRTCLPVPDQFLSSLKAQSWFESVQDTSNPLRITVTSVEQAKKGLLHLVNEHNLVLNRYEWVRPTLEEIFLKISA
jgi:ABC-2 type transport system ATP-binding protein